MPGTLKIGQCGMTLQYYLKLLPLCSKKMEHINYTIISSMRNYDGKK